jgi:hypothetical protein
MAGPKLWILLRELQVTYPVAVTIANSISLVLQLMGVFALTWPTANQGSKARRMGVALRALMVIALVYWLAFVFKWVPSSALVNEVRSAALSWVMVLDVSCIALSGLIMGSISRRGGYRRVAIFIELAALVQAGGAALLFAGIYLLRRLEQPYIWTSLLMHAAGGVALTITGMWLMIKLLRGSQKVRAVVQVVDEKTHGP